MKQRLVVELETRWLPFKLNAELCVGSGSRNKKLRLSWQITLSALFVEAAPDGNIESELADFKSAKYPIPEVFSR